MIIIDMSQVIIANLMTQLSTDENGGTQIEEGLIRHMTLNALRSIRQRFKNEYGELVIACDNSEFWRKKEFPYYKANRKKFREESKYDWNLIFKSIHTIRDEISEIFPYRVINATGAEADDVIAILTKEFHEKEKIMIVSSDKDFGQLQKYKNVSQYDPARIRFIEIEDPSKFLKEHIIRGDSGDGIPNFLSQNDIFLLDGVRQKSIMSKKLEIWLNQEPEDFCENDEILRNYKRNQTLIDFEYIPAEIRENILNEYEKQAGKDRTKLFKYFIDKRLKNLMESIGEF